MSFKLKLAIAFLAISITLILFIATFSFYNAKNALQHARIAGLESIADLKVDKLETFFSELKKDMQMFRDSFNVKHNIPIMLRLPNDRTNPEYIAAKNTLDGQLKMYQQVKGLTSIMLISPSANIMYTASGTIGRVDVENPILDPNGRAFQKGKEGYYLSDPFRNGDGVGNFKMLVIGGVHDSNGDFLGFVVFNIDMSPIYKMIQDTTGLGETGETLIGKKTGDKALFLNPLRQDKDAALKRKAVIGSRTSIPMQEAVQGKEGSGLAIDYRGREIIAVWRHIPSLEWGLVAKIDTSEAFASVTKLRNITVIITLIGLSLATLVVLFIAGSVTRPIAELVEGTERIASGDLGYKISVDSADEIGKLAGSFNRMSGDLSAMFTERKQAEEQVQRQMQRLTILGEITKAINSSLDLRTILNVLLDKIDLLLPYSVTTLRLLNKESGLLEAVASRNIDAEEWKSTMQEGGRGFSKGALKNKGPVIIAQVQKSAHVKYPEFLRKYGLISYLGVPLIVKDDILGTLGFYTKVEHEFSKEEVEFLSTLAGQAAIAIDNAQLFKEVEKRTHELSALHAITTATSESLDLDSLLQEVIKKFTEVFYFDSTGIFLFDLKEKELHLRAFHTTEPMLFAQITTFRRGQGTVGTVGETGEPLIFEDIHTDPRYQKLSVAKLVEVADLSFLAVFPVKIKGKCIGTIVCVGKDTRRLTHDETQLIMSMTDQIGVAVENATLFQESVDRTRELSVLYSVSTIVNKSLNLDSILNDVMYDILRIFNFDAARIYLLDEDSKELRLKIHEGFSKDAIPLDSYQPGVGVIGNVFETAEPLVFEDIQNDSEFRRLAHKKIALRTGFRGGFFIPITSKSKTVGVMNFLSKEAHHFSPGESQLIHSIANQVGVAVENVRLYEQTKKQALQLEKDISNLKRVEKKLQARYKDLESLHEMGQTILSSPDLKTVLEKILDQTLSIGSFDIGVIRLLDATGQIFEPLALRGFLDPKGVRTHRVSEVSSGRILSQLMTQKEPQVQENIPGCDGMRTFKREGVQSAIMVPVRAREEVLGGIQLGSRTPRRFQPEEVRLLGAIGNQIGIAVQKARLFEETKKQALQLEKDITKRKRVEEQLRQANADLASHEKTLRETLSDLKESHEQLKAAQSQLIQAEKLESVGRLAAGVAHEVKNPLAIMLQGTHYLSKHLPANGDNVTMALQEMNNAVKRADSVVRGLLDFSAPSELSLNTEELNSVVEQSLSLVRHELDRYRVNAVSELSEHLPSVRLDRNKMEQVFVNVFLNAVHAMPEGGTLTVKTYSKQLTEVIRDVGSRKADDFRVGQTVVMAEIEDTGTGIPKDKLTEVFDPFFTTKSTGKGTGLGLTVTKKIIDLHGGTIDIGNRREGGARVTIMFKA